MKKRGGPPKKTSRAKEHDAERSEIGGVVDDPFAELRKVAKEFTAFRPAPEVFQEVRSVPTIFPDYDRATRVGGHPTDRITLVHGGSGTGKSIFNVGLILSFLMKDHPAALIDAERTTPITLLRNYMGKYVNHPFFFGSLPQHYEQTQADVRKFLNQVLLFREKGKLHDEATAIVVVDSIRKLVPADQFAIIMAVYNEVAQGKTTLEAANRRIGQTKARMNATWTDELVPLLEKTKSAMVIVAREMVDPDAQASKGRHFGSKKPATKTEGGVHLFYDASLDLEFELEKTVGKSAEGEKGRFSRYGDRYRCTIKKSKVSGKGEDYRDTWGFHLSNGVLVPEGFDRARDVIDVAQRYAVVEGTSWLKYASKDGRSHRWQGEHAAVKALTADEALMLEIENECRGFFKKVTG